LIRSATPDDAEAMSGLWDASARAGFAELLPVGHPFPSFDPDRLVELLADDGVRVLVDDRDGELRGHTSFGTSRDEDADASTGEVRSFFVSPSAWRCGIGTGLMARALEGLAQLGFEDATLWSFDANGRANGFYEHLGFRRDGATRTEAIWAYVLEVRYRRTLP
jgi:GNAT superfamily N-acetyltransferase